MKRSRKQLMMVILYAAAVLCFAFGDAFKITALCGSCLAFWSRDLFC